MSEPKDIGALFDQIKTLNDRLQKVEASATRQGSQAKAHSGVIAVADVASLPASAAIGEVRLVLSLAVGGGGDGVLVWQDGTGWVRHDTGAYV